MIEARFTACTEFQAAEGLRRQIVTFKIEAKLTHAQ
jgi:hypothetical protein